MAGEFEVNPQPLSLEPLNPEPVNGYGFFKERYDEARR
jgi:hypothetical protein